MSNESGVGPIDRDDAVGFGIEGLIQAVDNYDPERSTTFASFAIRRIRGSILDAIRRMDVLPRSLRRNAREIEKANSELAVALGRWSTLAELAVNMSIPESQLRTLVGHASSRIVSLERMTLRTSDGASPWEAPDQDAYADPAASADRKASLRLLGEALAPYRAATERSSSCATGARCPSTRSAGA